MRRPQNHLDHAQGLAILRRADALQFSSTTDTGEPLLRWFNAVVDDQAIYFHGAKAGEKTLAIGRPAVVAAYEPVAMIPSTFTDPERACPATTYYRSAMAKGRTHLVHDLDRKAFVFSQLMQRYQPQGGYAPIDPADPRYTGALRGVQVIAFDIDELTAKANLGQTKSPEVRQVIMEQLWQRGEPGDAEAIAAMLDANPGDSPPACLRGPTGVTFSTAFGSTAELDRVVELLAQEYWNVGRTHEQIRSAIVHATARLIARHPSTHDIVGFARALSDTSKIAWIYDVWVSPELRGKGVGKALMQRLVDHPRVRHARVIRLATHDAQRFYGGLGFSDAPYAASKSFSSTEMHLIRQ